MWIKVLKAKLHQARVTEAHLTYHGSLTVDEELIEAVGMVPYEAVIVSNLATGSRAETYLIPGERGKRQIGLNGAMARVGACGDRLIVMSFAMLEPDELDGHYPRVAVLDENNNIAELLPPM